MLRILRVFAPLFVMASTVLAQADSKDKNKPEKPPSTPAEQFEALKQEHQKALQALEEAQQRVATLPGRVLQLIEKHPKDPATLDAVLWLLQSSGSEELQQVALKILARDHVESAKLGPYCAVIVQTSDGAKFLREVIAKNKNRDVQGLARLALANHLKESADQVTELNAVGKMLGEAEGLYDEILTKFPDVRFNEATLGLAAKGELFELRNLVAGKPAPELEGEDSAGRKIKLSEHRGKVVVLDFWASWCGPCMEMIPRERDLVKKLEDKPFALIGVNLDDSREKLKGTEEREKINWRSCWDGQSGPIGSQWRIRYLPTIYVLDAKGIIRYKNVRGPSLDKAVEILLAEMEKK